MGRGRVALVVVLSTSLFLVAASAAPVVKAVPRSLDAASAPTLSGGAFHALAPARILDTRDGTGGFAAPVTAGHSIDVVVLGRGGIPASGVGSVVLNVTATNPTAATYVTVYPTGAPRPTASNLNPAAGQSVPNLVEVAVGAGGQVTAFNHAGSTDLIFDVAGWVATAPESGTDGLFRAMSPARLLDTRDGTGQPAPGPVGPGGTITLAVTGQSGVPATGVSAVVLNITVTNPTASTYITAFPDQTSRPLASNLNVVAGQTVPNRVMVKVGANGAVALYNNAGTVDLVADIGGYYTDGSVANANGARFTGVTPVRLLDTRSHPPAAGPGAALSVPVAGRFGLPASDAQVPPTAAVMNVTATGPTAAGYLTAFPGQHNRPLASDLNFKPGLTVPNLVVVKLGPGGTIDLYNSAGTTQVVVDLLGYYTGDIILQDGAHILDSTTLSSITSVTDTGVGFAGIPNQLTGIQPGDTLSAGISPQTPDGLMRLVDGIDTTGGNLTLTTEPASLDQLLAQASLNVGPQTPSGDLLQSRAAAGDVQTALSFSPLSFSHSVPFDFQFAGDAGHVQGDIGVSDDLTINLDVGLFPPRFDFDVTNTASAFADGSVSASVEASDTICTDLPAVKFEPVPIDLGPVVIVLFPEVQPSVCADGSVSAGLTAGAHASINLGLGVHHHDGNTTDDHSLTFAHTFDPASVTPGSARPDVHIKPAIDLKVLLDNAVEFLSTGPGGDFEVKYDGCSLIGTLSFGLHATLELKVWKFDLGEYPLSYNAPAVTLFAAPIVGCAYWTGSVTQVDHSVINGPPDHQETTHTWTWTLTPTQPAPVPNQNAVALHQQIDRSDDIVSGNGCANGTITQTGDDTPPAEGHAQYADSTDYGPSVLVDVTADALATSHYVEDHYGPYVDPQGNYHACWDFHYEYDPPQFGANAHTYQFFALASADATSTAGTRYTDIADSYDSHRITWTWDLQKHCTIGAPTDC